MPTEAGKVDEKGYSKPGGGPSGENSASAGSGAPKSESAEVEVGRKSLTGDDEASMIGRTTVGRGAGTRGLATFGLFDIFVGVCRRGRSKNISFHDSLRDNEVLNHYQNRSA